MGGKKKKQNQCAYDGESAAASQPSSLADFMSFPTLDGMSTSLPSAEPALRFPQDVDASGGALSQAAPILPPKIPPEHTIEELEARHKKEVRELEGAARAAKKAAGKNKAKVEEADANAEEAMTQLRLVHASEVRGMDSGDVTGAEGTNGGKAEIAREAGPAQPDIKDIKQLLSAPRPSATPSAEEELRIDPEDGNPYPLQSFRDVYGKEEGDRRWETALPSHGTGASKNAAGGNGGNRAPYIVMGSKKGGFPVSVESRARGKTVTVIHNVSGDVDALLSDLKGAVGAGGVVREGDVEVQGDHLQKVESLLVRLGCVKGVSHAKVAAAVQPAGPPPKAAKSIPRLDKKAAQPSR